MKNKTLQNVKQTLLLGGLSILAFSSMGQYMNRLNTAPNFIYPTHQQGTPTIAETDFGKYVIQTVNDDNDIYNRTDILISRIDPATGAATWTNVYGTTTRSEKAYGIVEGSGGRLLVVGEIGVAPNTQNYVFCIGPAGNVLWENIFGENDFGESARLIIKSNVPVASTAVPTFYVVGENFDIANKTISPQAFEIDETGAILWHQKYNEPATPNFFELYKPTSVIQDGEDDVVIAGHYQINGTYKSSLFTLTLDRTNGNILPNGHGIYKINGDITEEKYPSIIKRVDGAGFDLTFNSIYDNNTERMGFAILDNDKVLQGARDYKFNYNFNAERPISIKYALADRYYIALQRSYMSDTPGYPALITMNNAGAFIDGKVLVGTKSLNTQYMFKDDNGNLMIKSYEKWTNGQAVYNLLQTINPNGIASCARPMQLDDIQNLAIASGIGNLVNAPYPYVVAGPVLAPAPVPGVMNTLCAPVAKTDVTTSIAENGTEMKMYQNPTSGTFTLEVGHDNPIAVMISDQVGRNIMQKQITRTAQFDLSSYPKGIYIVQLKTENGIQIQKLIVE